MNKIKHLQKSFSEALLSSEKMAFLKEIEDSSIDKSKRFSLYQNSTQGTLLSVLDEIFKQTGILLGDICFNHLKQRYIRENPCLVKNLDDYGIDFPRFIAKELEDVVYLKDFAHLDLMWHQVFYTEDDQIVDQDQLSFFFAQDPENLYFRKNKSLIYQSFTFDIMPVWRNILNRQEKPREFEIGDQSASIGVFKNPSEREALSLTQDQTTILENLRQPTSLYQLADNSDGWDFNRLCLCLVQLVQMGVMVPYLIDLKEEK